MPEATQNFAARLEICKVDFGAVGGPNTIKQVTGTGSNGATIVSATGSLSIEQPINMVLKMNIAQLTGLFGYIGLINGGVDTSAIESAVASAVAAN
jgi:hypothetical protein